jgi:hypothetical protein
MPVLLGLVSRLVSLQLGFSDLIEFELLGFTFSFFPFGLVYTLVGWADNKKFADGLSRSLQPSTMLGIF